MVRHRITREGHESICIRDSPKENLILMHYMLSVWCLHLLDGLRHYVIRPGAISYILMMTNNIITSGYTYAKRRLKNPPVIFFQFAHISLLIAGKPSISSWNPDLQGRYQSLLHPSFPRAFTVTNNQDAPTIFDTSTRYTFWKLG